MQNSQKSFSECKFLIHLVLNLSSSADEEYRVKITDNALARDFFPGDYHCLGDNENRPVRWMAVESLEFNTYNTASVVVSIGCFACCYAFEFRLKWSVKISAYDTLFVVKRLSIFLCSRYAGSKYVYIMILTSSCSGSVSYFEPNEKPAESKLFGCKKIV